MLWHPQEILITTVDGGMQIFVGELMYANFCSVHQIPILLVLVQFRIFSMCTKVLVLMPLIIMRLFFPPFFLLAMRIVSFTCFMMFQRGY